MYHENKKQEKDEAERLKEERAKLREERQKQKTDELEHTKAKRKQKFSKNDSETENGISKPSKGFQKGDYVICEYEGEYYPGIVLKREATRSYIKVMAMAGPNVWKWPKSNEDVKAVISSPKLYTNRGHFRVPEINKFRHF